MISAPCFAKNVTVHGKVQKVECGNTDKDHQFYLATLKVIKSLKGSLSEKEVILPFSLTCDGYQPGYGELTTKFYPGDVIEIALQGDGTGWASSSGLHYKLISKGNGKLPKCSTEKGLCK